MLYNLSYHTTNVNSLVRTGSVGNNLTIPIIDYLLKTNCIEILSDTRMNEQKIRKIKSILCKSNQIGVEKERFYSTSQDNTRVGGVSIFIPQYLDSCLDVIYTKKDPHEIPRYLSIICKLQGGSNILICGFYGATQPGEKLDALKRLLTHLEELNERFSFDHTILAGDYNLLLDSISLGSSQESRIFNEILNLLNLTDSKICGHLPGEKEVKTLRSNGLDAVLSKDTGTYLPSIANQNSNRIDGFLISDNLQTRCSNVTYCVTLALPNCDHRGVFLSLTWDSIGIPCDNVKSDFFFRSHLLENKHFTKTIDKKMKRYLIEHYYSINGFLSRNEIQNCSFNDIENLILDAYKNNNCQNFSALDILYQLLEIIRICQKNLLAGRNKNENMREVEYVKIINQLEKIKNIQGTQKYQLRAACKDLADLKRIRLKRKAKDFSVDFEALNESGTRAFFRQKLAKRQKSFIRILKSQNGSYLTDSFSIENEFHDVYKGILEGQDPFNPELFYAFIADCRTHFKQIPDEARSYIEGNITQGELDLAVSKIRSEAAPGVDGISGSLLRYLYSKFPKLFLKATNEEILKGKCHDKEIMQRKLIFIEKQQSKRECVKKYRPISLISAVLKVADMTIVNRIVSSLHNNNILPGYICAYRKGFGTLDGILTLKCFIENAKRFNKKLLMVNWDLSQAFDKCSQLLTQECLKILGFSDFVIQALSKLPTSAIAKLCINFAESRFPWLQCSSGWPQGMSSSAHGFQLAMFCLLLKLEHANISGYKIKLYSNERKCKRDSFIQKESEKLRNENTGIDDKEIAKLAKNKWNFLSKQQKNDISEDLTVCKSSEKCIQHLSPVISYSDDGFLLLEYESISQIFNVFDIFKRFGAFSNLSVNTDKTEIYQINFLFSNEEKNQLLDYGFTNDKILDEKQCLTFLGHRIKPCDLFEGAKSQLEETIQGFENIISAYNNGNITLQGRKLVANSLLLSKIYSFSTACNFSKNDFSKLQQMLDGFTHKKRISAGGRKYLPLRYAGLYIPNVYLKHLTLRMSLIKKLAFKLNNNMSVPSWAEILIHVLKTYGFEPMTFFKSLGNQDVEIVIKILENQGLQTLSSIFADIQKVNLLFQKDANITGQYKKKKKQNKNNKQDQNCRTQIQNENRTDYMQTPEGRSWGSVRNSQTNQEDLPDPPIHYRSLGLVGGDYCNYVSKRNKMTMTELWQSSCDPNNRDFGKEMSARNPFLKSYVNLGLAQICAILDPNSQPRESKNLSSIVEQNDESRNFHDMLANFAKTICVSFSEKHGPSGSKYISNDFLTWLNSLTANPNSKSLYEKILKCTYMSCELTAIKKLGKIPYLGILNEKRICGAMNRITKSVNTARTLRASIEFCLGAFRSNVEIATFSDTNQLFCFCCGIIEKHKSINEAGRNPTFHLLFSGGPARFMRDHLKNYARQILGQTFDISLPAILFNEIPFHIVKRCDMQSMRRWYSVVNAYKATMFSLYYRRPTFDRYGSAIIRSFNHHLRSIKRVAVERGSDILDNILLLPVKGNSVTPFYKTLNDVYYDTIPFRQRDNRNSSFLSDYRKKMTRTKNYRKNKQTPKISNQKRQILIDNAFKKYYNLENLSQDQTVEICTNVNNSNNS